MLKLNIGAVAETYGSHGCGVRRTMHVPNRTGGGETNPWPAPAGRERQEASDDDRTAPRRRPA
jgi:hypothetical protein